jgi:hypothetical protein
MHIEKISRVLETLGYRPDDELLFTLRRFEPIDRIHTKIDATDDEEAMRKFSMFAERHRLRVIGNEFPSLNGVLKVRELIEFLREYDDKFDLAWCELDFKEMVIRPNYL